MNFIDTIKLIRANQWYKNLVIFLSLIFGKELFNLFAFQQTIIGFLALCLISSSNYIINDIIDIKKDRNNPEKKNRPLASGSIKIWQALIIFLFLLLLGLYISFSLSKIFFIFVLTLLTFTQLYSFILKNEIFADILLISLNFVIRTVSGSFVITKGIEPYIKISSWLILCPFFLALFLVTSKRESEILLLQNEAKQHKKILIGYTKKLTFALMIISTVLLISSYSLYVFFSSYPNLMFTLPFVLYLIFRFFNFVETKSAIARHPELLYKDKRSVITILIIIIITFFSIY